MGMLGAKKKVEAQLRGKDPKSIGFWFMDKSLVLLKESQVSKADVLRHVEENYK